MSQGEGRRRSIATDHGTRGDADPHCSRVHQSSRRCGIGFSSITIDCDGATGVEMNAVPYLRIWIVARSPPASIRERNGIGRMSTDTGLCLLGLLFAALALVPLALFGARFVARRFGKSGFFHRSTAALRALSTLPPRSSSHGLRSRETAGVPARGGIGSSLTSALDRIPPHPEQGIGTPGRAQGISPVNCARDMDTEESGVSSIGLLHRVGATCRRPERS